MLTTGSYVPPGYFTKLPHQAHSKTQISYMQVGARPLLDIIRPLCPGLCMSLVDIAPQPALFLGMSVGATACTWTVLCPSTQVCQTVPWSCLAQSVTIPIS